MNIRTSKSDRAAFTLIEVVVSAAIMTLILGCAYGCLSSALSSQRLLESRGEAMQAARVAMNFISADLRAACPLSKQVEFLGQHQNLGEAEADRVDFATHASRPRRAGEGDFCQMSYYLAPGRYSARLSLWRRRNPMIALDPLAGGVREEIVPGVRELRFEYYDGLDWYDDWGDATGKAKAQNSWREQPNLTGLPEAVRITLWVEPARRGAGGKRESRVAGEPPVMVQTVARLNLSRTAWGGGNESGAAESDENAPATSPPNNGGP